ncbi:hypothetical protein QJQ45_012967 [Haematococcus lacustris]|nr:hypothetical protein QJQ45_012967 [Haematococcus lacustris]
MAGCEAAHLGDVDVAAAEFGMDVSRVACCCGLCEVDMVSSHGASRPHGTPAACLVAASADPNTKPDPVVWCQDPVVWCQDPVGQDPGVRCEDPVCQDPVDPVVWYQDPVGQDPVVWCQDPVVRCQDPVVQDPVVRCQDPVVWYQDPVGQDPVVRTLWCQDPVVRDQDPVVPGPLSMCVYQDPVGQDPVVWCQDPVDELYQDPCGARTLWTLWVRCQDPVVPDPVCQDLWARTLWFQDPVMWYQDPVGQDPVVWCQDPVDPVVRCQDPVGQDPVGVQQDPVDPVCQNPVVRCQDPVGVQQDPVVRYQDPVVPEPCETATAEVHRIKGSHANQAPEGRREGRGGGDEAPEGGLVNLGAEAEGELLSNGNGDGATPEAVLAAVTGMEYQQRYKLVNDRLPKGRQWLHRAAEYRRGTDGRARNNA